jgi:hypothetical protein
MGVATFVITSPAEAWTGAIGNVGALPVYPGALSGTGLPMVFGQYTCHATPAATDIILGFTPRAILAWNATDGTAWWLWSTTFANDTAMKNVAGTQTLLASGGITPLATGFTIGVGAGVQTASKVFEFLAFR